VICCFDNTFFGNRWVGIGFGDSMTSTDMIIISPKGKNSFNVSVKFATKFMRKTQKNNIIFYCFSSCSSFIDAAISDVLVEDRFSDG